MKAVEALSFLEVYDWITILYMVIGISCFIWVSIGNDYIFKKIEKRLKLDASLNQRSKKCDLYYTEIRKSWLHNQNIWIAVEYFLVGLAYLSMVIVIYATVDNIVVAEVLKIKTAFYAIINLLASAFRDYLNPRKKSIGARNAYLLLNKAIIKYENGDGTKDELLEAFDKGERIMTKSTYEE
ncbi:MAG: hypothetical protein PHQ72_00510 [Hespellia sp.]|nr:hypothetical protein [Hespellia sp.]